MNVLTIGNSFSDDATRYLCDIATAAGDTLYVENICIGGCSLEQHYNNMLSGEQNYLMTVNGRLDNSTYTLDEGLSRRAWDIVTIQQVSHMSFNADSYQPYASTLVQHIRKRVPTAKILLHQTWAYEAGSERLHSIAGYDTPERMLSDIVEANRRIAAEIGADGIIPSGELFGKLICRVGTPLHRDTFHASLGLGRFALAALWYSVIFDKRVTPLQICALDEQVPTDDLLAAICAVNELRFATDEA